jgi:hypothetical protein
MKTTLLALRQSILGRFILRVGLSLAITWPIEAGLLMRMPELTSSHPAVAGLAVAAAWQALPFAFLAALLVGWAVSMKMER